MILDLKCVVPHDPESGRYGDCHRTCVAAILGLRPEDVPHIYRDPERSPEECDREMREWLAGRGLSQASIVYPGETTQDEIREVIRVMMTGVPVILGGQSGRCDCGHSIVVLDGETVCDPSDSGLSGPMEATGFWYVTVLSVGVPSPDLPLLRSLLQEASECVSVFEGDRCTSDKETEEVARVLRALETVADRIR